MTSDDNDDDDDDDEMLMLTSDYRCAVKCYVLFVEVATRQGTDVVLTNHCKSKVTVQSTVPHFTVSQTWNPPMLLIYDTTA